MLGGNKAFSGFAVDDIDAAKRFYGTTLALPVTERDGMLEVRLSDATRVLIYPKPDHTPASFTILNFPVDDIERVVDELREAGVPFETYEEEMIRTDDRGIHSNGGPKIAWFRDPAGNILSVLEED